MGELLNFIKFKFCHSDLVIFLLITIILTIVNEKIPDCFYYYKKWLFRERKWEEGGRLYERVFQIKKWKPYAPDISDFLKWRFSKKHLKTEGLFSNTYLNKFLTESCKSEFTHWMLILSSILFLFLGGVFSMIKILLLSAILNLPYILIQRYNRPRIIHFLNRSKNSGVTHYELASAKA